MPSMDRVGSPSATAADLAADRVAGNGAPRPCLRACGLLADPVETSFGIGRRHCAERIAGECDGADRDGKAVRPGRIGARHDRRRQTIDRGSTGRSRKVWRRRPARSTARRSRAAHSTAGRGTAARSAAGGRSNSGGGTVRLERATRRSNNCRHGCDPGARVATRVLPVRHDRNVEQGCHRQRRVHLPIAAPPVTHHPARRYCAASSRRNR